MRKFLLLPLLSTFSMLSAQELISFEASEGYVTGNINGQKGWNSTQISDTEYIANQVVTSEMAFDGQNSFKVMAEPMFGPQNSPVVGGFYPLETPASATDFIVSFDLKIPQQSDSSSDFAFIGLTTNTTSPQVVYYILMGHDGKVVPIIKGPDGLTTMQTTTTWNIDSWYRLKIVGSTEGISYYLNDQLVATTEHLSDTPTVVNKLHFVNDNYGGEAFIDRIAINNEEALATDEVVNPTNSTISIYVDNNSEELLINSKNRVEAIQIYDVTGKLLLTDALKKKINISNLNTGTYIISIETKEGTYSEKFMKK